LKCEVKWEVGSGKVQLALGVFVEASGIGPRRLHCLPENRRKFMRLLQELWIARNPRIAQEL